MQISNHKIYCAGPLFTDKEREEMLDIATALEDAGYRTFLPQRDGLELTKCIEWLVSNGQPREEAGRLMSFAIFSLDIYQVLCDCDAIVANLNGRVPDEGAVSEVAMAWSRGKPVIGYKADSRTVFGGQDNPLVAGLFEFNLCDSIEQIVSSVRDVLVKATDSSKMKHDRDEEIKRYTTLGRDISKALERQSPVEEIVDFIVHFSNKDVTV
jgi:nucleoside 2-deoxyribosyltransferase